MKLNKITYSIEKYNNGYETVYLPKENGEVFAINGARDRWMKTFKTQNAAVKFLIKQGAKPEEIACY